jgi:hypothetical protein
VPPSATPVLPTDTPLPPTATNSATAVPSATPTAQSQAGAILLGRVRVQTRSVWGDTTIFVDGQPRAITGDDGWFVLLGLTPGLHVVRAQRTGALSSEGTFYVQPGVVNYTGETLMILGDVYDNDRIDLFDWMLVQAAIGRCVGDPSFQSWIDLDLDGCVTSDDLRYVEDNLGFVGPTEWSPIP